LNDLKLGFGIEFKKEDFSHRGQKGNKSFLRAKRRISGNPILNEP
jgi:hypothetical protein